jgi:hypothetical protein
MNLKLLVRGRSSGTIEFSLKIGVNKTMTLNLSDIRNHKSSVITGFSQETYGTSAIA